MNELFNVQQGKHYYDNDNTNAKEFVVTEVTNGKVYFMYLGSHDIAGLGVEPFRQKLSSGFYSPVPPRASALSRKGIGHAAKIYSTVQAIIELAEEEGMTIEQVADTLASMAIRIKAKQ